MGVFLLGGADNQDGQNIARDMEEWEAFVDEVAAYRPALPAPEPEPEPIPLPEPVPEPPPPTERRAINWPLIIVGGVAGLFTLFIGLIVNILYRIPATGLQSQTERGRTMINDKTLRQPVIEPLLLLAKSRRAIIAALLTVFVSAGLVTIPEMQDSLNTYITLIIATWLGVATNLGIEDVIAQWRAVAITTPNKLDDAAVNLAGAIVDATEPPTVEPEAEDVAA
jgi:hypothetical protein